MENILTTKSFSVPLSLRMSGSALKIIAILSMVADHYAYFLLDYGTPIYNMLRCFGRIAFPVFAFLIAEGFANTRSRTRYFLTLLGFAIVSEIPWFLLNGIDGTHNVMFTLFLGVAALSVFDRLCEHGPLCCFSILILCFLAWWSGVDYDWRGVLMIVIFYMLRRQTIEPWICRNSVSFPSQAIMQILFTFPLMMHYGIVGSVLASIVIFLYDGTRGNIKGAVAKYSFYAFYPLHLFLLYFIQL
ncbi:MAG: conjugal transfer protein TraX [Muribaculaceae bacterium]|nr:conjugal transfer protein TraX [Muribaculaceae bacterium]